MSVTVLSWVRKRRYVTDLARETVRGTAVAAVAAAVVMAMSSTVTVTVMGSDQGW